MPDYLPADIICVAPNGRWDIPGDIITLAETVPDNRCPKWSCHSAIVYDPATIIEQLWKCEHNTISKYTQPGSQPAMVLRVASWTDAQRQAAAGMAYGMIGSPYGVADVLADAVDSAVSAIEGRDVVYARKGAPVATTRDCSVMVARCAAVNSWSFCGLGVSAVEPSDIYCDYMERPGEYEMVFCAESLRRYVSD
jgi:hypothetical protein